MTIQSRISLILIFSLAAVLFGMNPASAKSKSSRKISSSFDWRRDACPIGDEVDGKDFNMTLAQDILRAELHGWRSPGARCLDPSTFRYFRAEPFDVTDASDIPQIKVKRAEDARIIAVKKSPLWPTGNLYEAQFVIKDGPREVTRGKFLFERIKGMGPYKDLTGCAAMHTFPKQIITLEDLSCKN